MHLSHSVCVSLWQPKQTHTGTHILKITKSSKTLLCFAARKLIFATADYPYAGTKAFLVWCQNPLYRDTFYLNNVSNCIFLQLFMNLHESLQTVEITVV